MARAGLGQGWACLCANDINAKKSASYAANWGGEHLKVGDVAALTTADLPGRADLAWASFPCQDLSLAGNGAGLNGSRSGTFWPFWRLMLGLVSEGRPPNAIALENVCGAITSHEGKDFEAICSAFAEANYAFGACVVDAALFVPQSRPRLFLLGVRRDLAIPPDLIRDGPALAWHPPALRSAFAKMPAKIREAWVWWSMPEPTPRKTAFCDLIEDDPIDVAWHPAATTRRILEMMSPVNIAKVRAAQAAGRRMVGTIYRRTRCEEGRKTQRAEVRFDEVAGCLRTPAGGSSRQAILVVEGRRIRSRLISARETARLMGLPDSYRLPDRYNDAYLLTGDGVAVPVVRHIAEHLLEPVLASNVQSHQIAETDGEVDEVLLGW